MVTTAVESVLARVRLLTPDDLDDADRACWHDLAVVAGADVRGNAFFGPEVLGAALATLDEGAEVRLLVLESGEGGRWRAVLPVIPRRRAWRHPVRAHQTWLHEQAFLGSPLVAPDLREDEWDAVLEGLRGTGARWWVADKVDVLLAADIEAAAGRAGLPTTRFRAHERAATRRRADGDYVARAVSGKNRKELRRLRRRLDEQLGGLRTVELAHGRPPAEALAAAHDFLDLEAAGWKGVDGGAMSRRDAEARFFVSACSRLAGTDRLHVLGLLGGGDELVAALVLIRDGATLSTWKVAYDERWAASSPGTLLLLDAFETFQRSGALLLDSCADPGHALAERLNLDRRGLTALAVALDPVRGGAAVRSLPRWYAGVQALRARAGRRGSAATPDALLT